MVAMQSQEQSLSAEESRLQGEVDAARRALADAQAQTDAARREFQTLQGEIASATAELNALQAQIRAAKPPADSPPGTSPNR
jgi:chromosome segregation ATPase